MTGVRGWTLRLRVVALLTVVGVLLGILVAAVIVVAAQNRQYTHNVLDRSGPLRAQSQELLGVLVDQETAVRGYAVTGDPDNLTPYHQGRDRERQLYQGMRSLIGPYPDLAGQLDTVEAQAGEWRATVAEPIIEVTARDGTAAGQALVSDQSRLRFDGIRASLDALQDGILAERERGAGRIYRTSSLLVVLLIAAVLVVVVAGVVLLVSLDRIVVRPLIGVAAQVRQVAGGDYRHVIAGSGPPEFQRLAADVDAMRRKIAEDLDEVREARERIGWVNGQLQRQAEELTRSNRDLEQFAYVASHDLQEPLRKVASFCQLLQRRYAGQLDERADQYIAFAVDGAQRMQRLINDLLAFSRIGRLTTGFTEVDLNKVMGDVAAQTEAARQYADAELTWGELPVIRGEAPLLTNLLANLVGNSVKFRRAGVPPKVRVSARLVGAEWEISCEDNGIGIEPEFTDKIFVIFQRLHARDAYPGTGIGLAIVKKIVEYHDGRVWVDTSVSGGTAIRFTVPALPEQVDAAEDTTTVRADGGRADGGETAGGVGATDGPDSPGGVSGGDRTGGMREAVG
ncbi:CHASE3 domain-containing protein [Micromonospora sp. WMMA1363]|uniref:sensor histidine kinase n=1 Tax=Micromonospora sp. WMMA1363 TaxID=3053985 RepID=UPI00259C7712|nr:sensor histidine kinase [Micromonospora sp. WMMA1363]MDM4720934.1 CHASE3 domain-containing protein [Micromonospora sp. WMMA1363]